MWSSVVFSDSSDLGSGCDGMEQTTAAPHPNSKKSTLPVSSEYSAPTIMSPSR